MLRRISSTTNTLTFAQGPYGAALHAVGDTVWLSPSVASIGAIELRLGDAVRHLDIHEYRVDEATIPVAVNEIVAHLRGG